MMNVPLLPIVSASATSGSLGCELALGLLLALMFTCSACRDESAGPPAAPSAQATRPSTTAPADAALYVCRRAPEPIAIDGKLTDAAWSKADWTPDFADLRGPGHPVPPLRTRSKLLWDDKYLYIACEIQEPHVWAAITDPATPIFFDNAFELFFDPQGQAKDFWELQVNALGTVWNGQMDRPFHILPDKKLAGVRAAAQVQGTANNPADQDQGWTVELAIPFASLAPDARAPRDGDTWRMNLARVNWPLDASTGQYRKIEKKDPWYSCWAPPGVINLHTPDKYGRLRFSNQ